MKNLIINLLLLITGIFGGILTGILIFPLTSSYQNIIGGLKRPAYSYRPYTYDSYYQSKNKTYTED